MMADFTKEQLDAITAIDRNVAVSAGAGSGKTRVLVERYLYILKQEQNKQVPVNAGEILAITFTRKAAAEMKERVRRSMEQLSRQDDGSRYFWQKQLKELEKAQITTIHSLCSRILKENPVEAGLDPAFKVVEEFEGQSFLEKCLKGYFRSALKKEDVALQLLIKNYGVHKTLRQLYSLLPQLSEIIAAGDLQKPYIDSLQQAESGRGILCSLLDELVARRGEIKKGKKVEQLQLLAENLQEIKDGISNTPADYTMYNRYVSCLRKDSVLKELIASVQEQQQKLLLADADRQALPVADAWQQVIVSAAEYIMQKKIAGDFLTFDDLEDLALQLLRDNEHLCRKYQNKYRYIMVDEFQDTNEKQKQLVYLLCGGDASRLQGEKLFIVGDAKQSIYRFRGADVSVFAGVRRDIVQSGGSEITLADNFRTVDVILEVCNEVFAELLGTDKNNDIYFEALAAHNSGLQKPVFMQLGYDDQSKACAREAEAAAVAQKMLALHARGTAFKNMAVLLSTMTKCELFTSVFDRYHLPYQVIDGRGFYGRQEVLDILNLCAALHNKNCSLELAGVLRSPYFGIDDETLTVLFIADPGLSLWDKLQGGVYNGVKTSQQQLLRRAAVLLADLRRQASLLSLNELWSSIWQKLHIDAVLTLQENGAGKLANVSKLRSLATEFAAAKQGTLASWLEYTQSIIELGGRETAANIDAEDAVTIMTIHKSKGLEFDTVFLPLLDARLQSDTDEIKFDKSIGLGIKVLLPDGTTADSSVLKEIKELDKNLQAAERYRQLYVAMTRAKSRLILSGIYNKEKKSSSVNWFTSLQKLLAERDLVQEELLDVQEISDAQDIAASEPAAGIVFDEGFLEPLPDFAKCGSRVFSASSLQTYLYCQRQYFYKYVARLPQLEEASWGGTGLPAKVRGLIIHKALEKYNGDADVAWQAAVMQEAGGDFALAREAQRMFSDYLGSDLFASIPARHQRELPFTCQSGGYTVQGIIDCLYEDEDGSLTIVDYKTGRPPVDKGAQPGYMLQLALYKQAAQKLLRKKVCCSQLHFLQDLSCVTLEDGQEDHLQQAQELFAEISAKEQEADFACNLASCADCPYNYLCPQK